MALKFYLKNIPFEFERDLCKNLNKFFRCRPSSAPFLSGDSFRSLANLLYDETSLCHAEDIFENAIVFVGSQLLIDFATQILPKLQSKFILITHQNDINISTAIEYRSIADNPHIKHWFAQNCILEHPKLSPLPIGLEDRWRHNAGALSDFKKAARKQSRSHTKQTQKKAAILMAFSLNTNPDSRFACYRALWHQPHVTEIQEPLNAHLYRKRIQQYMYVASPAGNGLDCHRSWEAMYLGVIPLVEDNYMNRYFASLGLPLLCISDWNICKNWDADFLQKQYDQIMTKADTSALKFDWWKKRITAKKDLP